MKGKFTTIKDCAEIADNTVLPPNTVVPALALFSGSPGPYFPKDPRNHNVKIMLT